MHQFRYVGNQLFCEGVSVDSLARKFGTPLYVYSQATLADHFQKLDHALAPLAHLICFAMKANSNLSVMRSLANLGSGFDVVSAGELQRVIAAGGDPKQCVFAGVAKSAAEIEFALRQGIYSFNCESEPEILRINQVAARLKKRAPIAVRINPNVSAKTHSKITTGTYENKFGIQFEHVEAIYARAGKLSHIWLRGVQMHIGSQITKTPPYRLAIQKLARLADQVRALAPATLQSFDIGGGLGICYRNETPPTAQQFATAVLPLVKKTGLRLLVEPGRFIVGNGGVLVARVVYVKQTPVKTFVITDAGMNDLIRPALYESYHEILPVKKTRGPARKADIVGPVCESGDFFAQDRLLPVAEADDLLAVMSAGAYGMAMTSNYNARPRPAEVLVAGSGYRCVRKREQLADLIRGEAG